jgi:hypothetical protein
MTPFHKPIIRTIRLPAFGITIRLVRGDGLQEPGSGTITSRLRGPGKTAAERCYRAAIDGLESLVLAHVCAGMDVQSPAYLEGIEGAVEAIVNHYG